METDIGNPIEYIPTIEKDEEPAQENNHIIWNILCSHQ